MGRAVAAVCATNMRHLCARAHNSTRHVWGDTAPPRPVLLFCMFILRSRKRELLRLIFAFSHIIAHMHARARARMPVGWRDRAGAAAVAVAAAPAPRRREHERVYRRYANAHASANAIQYIYSIYTYSIHVLAWRSGNFIVPLCATRHNQIKRGRCPPLSSSGGAARAAQMHRIDMQRVRAPHCDALRCHYTFILSTEYNMRLGMVARVRLTTDQWGARVRALRAYIKKILTCWRMHGGGRARRCAKRRCFNLAVIGPPSSSDDWRRRRRRRRRWQRPPQRSDTTTTGARSDIANALAGCPILGSVRPTEGT